MPAIDLPKLARAKGRRIRLREIGPTVASEVRLGRMYASILRGGADEIRKTILPLFVETKRQLSDAEMQDNIFGLEMALRAVWTYFKERMDRLNIRRIIEDEAKSHERRFVESAKTLTKIDIAPVLNSTDMGPHIEASVVQSTALIRGVTDELVKRITSIVIEAGRKGTRNRVLASALAKQFGWSQKRAKLIARDQLATFNGTLNRVRQQQVGISKYEWSTSLDERVRPLHREREGKTFSWSNPPSDGHPGEPINCRCVAIAVIE